MSYIRSAVRSRDHPADLIFASKPGVYNRSGYKKAVRLALARWTDHVLALVEGRTPADNVLAFG